MVVGDSVVDSDPLVVTVVEVVVVEVVVVGVVVVVEVVVVGVGDVVVVEVVVVEVVPESEFTIATTSIMITITLLRKKNMKNNTCMYIEFHPSRHSEMYYHQLHMNNLK